LLQLLATAAPDNYERVINANRMKNLIDALYVHNSGGKVLLDYLLSELRKRSVDCFLLLDERSRRSYEKIYEGQGNVLFLKASLRSRKQFYIQHRNRFRKILCFGNIPPPVKTSGTVYTYFHNVLLLKQPARYPFRNRLLKKLKGAYIRSVRRNTDFFIVQSTYVKDLLIQRRLCQPDKCLVIPFFEIKRPAHAEINENKITNTFLYISNGNPHKNHDNLLKAWRTLHAEGINPELNLTITKEYKEKIAEISSMQEQGINVVNYGFIDPAPLYQRCEYLIYPSIDESFGLGLIEGASFNCKIVAADLPYARAVVQATASFDPKNPDAIAAGVKHCINEQCNTDSKILVKDQIDDLIEIFS